LLRLLLLLSLVVFPTVAPSQSQPRPQPKTDQKKEVTVYVTRTGKKYHVDGCRYLRQSRIPVALKDAKAQGYTPCAVCRPPR